jgi:hypothetical protein
MALCNECGDVCILVSDDCLCHYSPLSFLKLVDFPDLVDAANTYIEDLTGECDLCEGLNTEGYQHQAVIDDVRFKRLYCALIYAEWLENYGDGKPTAAGFSTPNGDNFSDFSIQSGSQVKFKLKRQREKIESLTKKFKVLVSENGCIDEAVTSCGCASNSTNGLSYACGQDCNCNNSELPSFYSGNNQAFL